MRTRTGAVRALRTARKDWEEGVEGGGDLGLDLYLQGEMVGLGCRGRDGWLKRGVCAKRWEIIKTCCG